MQGEGEAEIRALTPVLKGEGGGDEQKTKTLYPARLGL